MAALIFSAAVLMTQACQQKQAAGQPQMPPPTVGVVTVEQKDVATYGDWVASLDGSANANIQPQVSGYLIKQNYREGAPVHKGDVLFEIDPRPFEAQLAQAKGQLAQAKGQLAQAQAQFELSEINVKRDTPLAKARAIAQSQLDNDLQTREQSKASVATSQASIEAAQAAVQTAELNLGFTKVRSLLDGIAGIATTQIGNLVSQTTVLTTVSQVNPIRVYFPISEQEYLHLNQQVKSGKKVGLLQAKDAVPLQLTLSDGTVYGQTGRIAFTDRQVDPQTGTIRIVGLFNNPGNILRPGQFGKIRTRTGFHKDALLVPQKAVSELQGRYNVAVLGGDNKVMVKNVDVGDRVGSLWVINKGLNPGDRVIADGVGKVRDGMPVNAQNVPMPESNTEQASNSAGAGGAQ